MKRYEVSQQSRSAIILGLSALLFAVAAFILAVLYHGRSLVIISQLATVLGSYITIAILVIYPVARILKKRVSSVLVVPWDRPGGRAAQSIVVLPRRRVVAIISVIGLVDVALSVSATALLISGPTQDTLSLGLPKTQRRNTPLTFDLPPGYTRTGCVYDVSYHGGRVKPSHDIQPGGKIGQEFIATQPYIVSMDVNIGINPDWTSTKSGTIQMDLLKGDGTVLAHHNPIQIINNRATTFPFAPVKVQLGKPYWLWVVNISKFVISPYMRYRLGPEGEHLKPRGAGKTRVYGEVNREDVERYDEALVGCVRGARHTGR